MAKRFIGQDELNRGVVASGPRVRVDLGEGRQSLDGVVEATALDFARIAITLDIRANTERVAAAVVEVVSRMITGRAHGWHPIATPRVVTGKGELERLVRESFPIRLLPRDRAHLWPVMPPELKEGNAERALAAEFAEQRVVTVGLPFALTSAWDVLATAVPQKERRDQSVMRRAAFVLAEIHRMPRASLRVLCFRPNLGEDEALRDWYNPARFQGLLRRAIFAVQRGNLVQSDAFRPIRLDPSPPNDGTSDGFVRSLLRRHNR